MAKYLRNNFYLEKIEWSKLQCYLDNNLIISQKHPNYDIWILNYSPKAQYAKYWDEYTLSCRGLVIDIDGNILARPFKKFFNWREHDIKDVQLNKEYEIFEKMDGSFIQLFYYEKENEWIFTSRGSFISEQALEARKMVDDDKLDELDKRCTYVFEIIY
jgi:RNA ligase